MRNILIGILLFLTACSTEQVVKNFPRSENINMNEVVLPEQLYSLGTMFTTDDYLVVHQSSLDSMLFSYYSLDDLHFVFGGGRRGQGPDDFTLTLYYRYITVEGNGFGIIDYPFIKHVDIEGERLKVAKQERINLPGPPNNYSKIDENIYCIANVDPRQSYEFVFFDMEGNNPNMISPYPNWANVKEEPPMFTYGNFVVANSDLKRLIVFYANFRRVRMFDSQGSLLKDISVEFPFKLPQYEEGPSKMRTYSIPYSDDKYIYVICNNAKPSEKQELTELQIWNWNAEPVAVLYLDKGLRQFTISQEKQRLYAIDPLNDDNAISSKIFWCDLPAWLFN